MPQYLDYNATSPVLPEVADVVYKMMVEEFGNPGSRTHEFGAHAKRVVEKARAGVAELVDAKKAEVIFTSGATESNNIAILGLAQYADEVGKKHIITSAIEHKAVLEPCEYLETKGFEVTYLTPGVSGLIDPQELESALRDDTLLVSLMHINNETGCIQPIEHFCELLSSHEAFFHVDAAQSFGKMNAGLENHRIDMISISGHKIYAPKGIGALVTRRRDGLKLPLAPIMFGGGQESGLRPGTLAAPLIAGLGMACQKAKSESFSWKQHAQELKQQMLDFVGQVGGEVIGDNTSPYVINFAIPGVNSEAAMLMLKEVAAVSNGSACTSNSYEPSHVLTAMGLDADRVSGSIRVSWSHLTKEIPVEKMKDKLSVLL